jgi:hypothetical protein
VQESFGDRGVKAKSVSRTVMWSELLFCCVTVETLFAVNTTLKGHDIQNLAMITYIQLMFCFFNYTKQNEVPYKT